MTVGAARAEGTALLRSRGIEAPESDAALLLADLLHTDRSGLILRWNESLPGKIYGQYQKRLTLRISGVCVAYIVGSKEFYGLSFRISPAVLVPRPDTETLVSVALEYLHEAFPPISTPYPHRPRILDLCTGSGCIAISLAKEYPEAIVSASDISKEALRLARWNSRKLLKRQTDNSDHEQGSDEKPLPIRFIHSDLFSKIRGKYDLIISNPPYIPTAHIANLSREVQSEPILALDGGTDGLALIRPLLREASLHLDQGGSILIESGSEQVNKIRDLMEQQGFDTIHSYQDLAGLPRVIAATIRNPGER